MVKTTIKIDGMMCSMCESHINDVIRNKFKVKKVTSSHSKGQSVVISEDALDENALRDAIKATGYHFQGVKTEEWVKKGLFGRRS